MKRISILAVAAVAALSVVAAIGATSASATVLCKKDQLYTCTSQYNYGVGTKLTATLNGPADFTLPSGEIWSRCWGGSLSMEVTDAGGTEKPVLLKDLSGSFTGCSWTTTFTKYGSRKIELPEEEEPVALMTGTGEGGTEILLPAYGINCTFRFIPPFSVISGTSPELRSERGRLLPGNGNSCPELYFSGSYSLTPSPLYVAALNFG